MKLEQVAVQLYTLRDHLKTPEDYDDSLSKVAQIGYRSVQVSGPRPMAPREIAELCRKYDLVINSTHENSQLILDDPAQIVRNLTDFGCQYTAYPFPAGVDFGSLESVNTLIQRLNNAGRVLAEAGMVLTYHNHNHEFRKLDGLTFLERVFRDTDPRFVQGELDTYWVQYGGGNVEAWCRKLKNRLPLLHIKDYRTNDENRHEFSEIGNGVLDFRAIIAAAEQSGCKWFIVEQDQCPGDPFDSLEQSFRYIKDNLID